MVLFKKQYARLRGFSISGVSKFDKRSYRSSLKVLSFKIFRMNKIRETREWF